MPPDMKLHCLCGETSVMLGVDIEEIYLFRNFPCIHSFPQHKDTIVSLGLLAFICFCDGWGAGPPHRPPTWGTRIFCQGYLP
jgi:hypothetical protein